MAEPHPPAPEQTQLDTAGRTVSHEVLRGIGHLNKVTDITHCESHGVDITLT